MCFFRKLHKQHLVFFENSITQNTFFLNTGHTLIKKRGGVNTEKIFKEPAGAGYEEIFEYIARLDERYSCVTVRTVGESLCGRKITAIEIGSVKEPVLMVGGTHGMEWASVLSALRLCGEAAHFFTKRGGDGKLFGDALERRGVVFIPLLNPDGYEIRRHGRAAAAARARALSRFSDSDFAFWQSNARGVDLNRNFNAAFGKARRAAESLGIRGASPTRYGGPFPFSEPETRAVRRACGMYRPSALYTLHSQGEEIYWTFGDTPPERSEYIGKTLAALGGYELCEPDAIAVGAGLKDWFIKKYRRPGFTIELGKGKNPLDYADFESIYAKARKMLLVALII